MKYIVNDSDADVTHIGIEHTEEMGEVIVNIGNHEDKSSSNQARIYLRSKHNVGDKVETLKGNAGSIISLGCLMAE